MKLHRRRLPLRWEDDRKDAPRRRLDEPTWETTTWLVILFMLAGFAFGLWTAHAQAQARAVLGYDRPPAAWWDR